MGIMLSMKSIIFIAILTGLGVVAACMTQSASVAAGEDQPAIVEPTVDRQPVLVELFTSEGCSSCPPADRVLAILEKDQLVPSADVITLAFHVDYWDRLGWKDSFSQHEYTERQEAYARSLKGTAYTPQMVVDGTREFVGSTRSKANDAIKASANEKTGIVEVINSAGSLNAKISGISGGSDATVYLAIAEDGLSTDVKRGENGGKTLPHSSVVRQLISIGAVKGAETSFETEYKIPTDDQWTAKNLRYVVFVQRNKDMKVLAVGQVRGK